MSKTSNDLGTTLSTLAAHKAEGRKFACLTAYGYCEAHAVSRNGVELILVGDSLGMVVQGHDSPLPVTVADVAYHTACVRRGNQGALLMADLPFASFASERDAIENAAKLMRAGAQIVKIEGGEWLADTTRALVRHGIPVCVHLGLTPQSVHQLGGYRVQGRDAEAADAIVAAAVALAGAGAAIVLLEAVPSALARRVTESVPVPVIGIGAGPDVDGQILVLPDLLGIWPGRPAKFVRNFLDGRDDGVDGAIAAYVAAVADGSFPAPEHCYD